MNHIQAHCKEFALVLPGCEYVFIQLKCEHFIINTVEITWLSSSINYSIFFIISTNNESSREISLGKCDFKSSAFNFAEHFSFFAILDKILFKVRPQC